MIDFRYHLVSIVAVFLALAIGIVVGSTALQPAVVKTYRPLANAERSRIDAQDARNKILSHENTATEAFAQAVAPLVLRHLLDHQQVVLVAAPGASASVVSGITTAVRQAGGQVSGQVSLQPQFFDTSAATRASLDGLARQLAPVGVDPGSAPSGNVLITGQQEAAQVIAAALMTRNGTGLSRTQSQGILAGFSVPGYLTASAAGRPANVAVVIAPDQAPTAGDGDPQNLALIALAQQLGKAGSGVVLAGSYPGSGPGSAIDYVVSGGSGASLSTVDDANLESGQIATVWALNRLLAGQKPAAYGIYANAVPSPAPTAAPTASAGLASPSPSGTPAGSPAAGQHRSLR